MNDNPKPKESPQIQADRLADVGEDEPRTDPRIMATLPPDVREEVRGYVHQRAAETAAQTTLSQVFRTRLFVLLTTGSIGGMTLGGVAYAFETLREKARDAGTEAAQATTKDLAADIKGLEARQTVTEQQVPELRAEVARLRDAQYQAQLDSRDLYKAVMEGKRSERLETPPQKPEPVVIPPVVIKVPGACCAVPSKDGGK